MITDKEVREAILKLKQHCLLVHYNCKYCLLEKKLH